MDIENNIHSSNDVLDDTLQISIGEAPKCNEVNCKEDNVKLNSEKCGVVWTAKDISTLLKIYEDKLLMLKTPKKRTRIWIVISKCLKRYNIEVTPDQVRWKMHALRNIYQRCLNCGQHKKFRYFKQMHKIYGHLKPDADDTRRMVQKKQSCYNAKLISKLNHKSSSKKFQESTGIVQLRKMRLAKRIESDGSQSKSSLDNQRREYLKRQEEQNVLKDENDVKNVEVRQEELELRKQTLKISETFDDRKMQMWERKHETLLRIEREKFEMLKKMSLFQK